MRKKFLYSLTILIIATLCGCANAKTNHTAAQTEDNLSLENKPGESDPTEDNSMNSDFAINDSTKMDSNKNNSPETNSEAADSDTDNLNQKSEKTEANLPKNNSENGLSETETRLPENSSETGTELTKEEALDFFQSLPQNFTFSSGAGAWSTVLTLSKDGSFEGYFHDSDMGDIGEGYNGTVYLCHFNGQFSQPIKVNDYIYECKVEKLDWAKDLTEEITDDTRYIYSDPYGLSESASIRIYLPKAPLSEVEQGFLNWAHIHSEKRKFLPNGFYGIYNVGDDCGFVGISDDCIMGYTYQAFIGDIEIRIIPDYFESYLFLAKEKEYFNLNFDWYDEEAKDFEASTWDKSESYDLHLDFSDDYNYLTMTLKSKDGSSLEQWGGSADGELTTELERITH